MKASLHHIKFYSNKDDDNPISIKEFIVFGPSQTEIEATASNILTHYKNSLSKPYQYYVNGGPLPVRPIIRGRQIKKPIDWKLLQARREMQEQARPHGQGSSIFRGLPETDRPTDVIEYREILRDSIVYFLSKRKQADPSQNLLFVGSTYDDEQHVRSGEVVIIEASNLDESGEFCDLIFLCKKPVTTLTEFCVPVFSTADKIGD